MKLLVFLRLLDLLAWWGFARALLRRVQPQTRHAKRQRADFYRDAWQRASRARGASSHELKRDLLEIRTGRERIRVMCNYTPLDDPVTLRLAGDKALVLELMREAGLPVPDGQLFYLRTIRQAAEFLRSKSQPCVVKPACGTGAGHGVTTGIRTQWQLLIAAAGTGVLPTAPLLIEAEVPGDNYRLLMLDGELLDAVRRISPCVKGDGKSTIRELVRRTNAERLRGGYQLAQSVLGIGAEMRSTLARQGLSIGSVPAAGDVIDLATAINNNTAVENEEATALLCPAIVAAAAKAAAVVGARLAGVDIITTDPRRPLEDTGGVILEVNTTPGFHFHYHRRGKACPVAEHVLGAVLGSEEEKTKDSIGRAKTYG